MIGIFDSGIGGITVVKEIKRAIPNSPILYFGDTARLPYGNRSQEIIKKYTREDIEFLISKGAKVIVAACNSASTVINDEFKRKYKVPIFEVITPAVKAAIAVTKNGRIGVIGTKATVNSRVYEERLREFWDKMRLGGLNLGNSNISNNKSNIWNKVKTVEVFSQACPLFVPLVEEGWIKRPETKMIARKYLQNLKIKNIDTLILGCTHYPLLKGVIGARMGRRVKLVDCAEEVAKALMATDLGVDGHESQIDKYYISDLTPHFQELAEKILGGKVNLEKI